MLQAVWEDYRDRGVTFVGVAFQTDEAAIADSLATHGVTYQVGLDAVGQIAVSYGITGVPETFILSPEGAITFVGVGPLRESVLRAELDAVLAEAAP